MLKFRVFCDVDDVIADFTGWWLKKANHATGKDFTIVNPEEYWVEKKYGLTAKEEDLVWRHVDESRSFDIEPLPGAIYFAQELLKLDIELFFLTSPMLTNKTWFEDRVMWFETYVGGGTSRKLVFSKRKDIVSGDIIIDDKQEHVTSFLEANPTATGFLMIRDKIVKTEGVEFEEILELVKQLKKTKRTRKD